MLTLLIAAVIAFNDPCQQVTTIIDGKVTVCTVCCFPGVPCVVTCF